MGNLQDLYPCGRVLQRMCAKGTGLATTVTDCSDRGKCENLDTANWCLKVNNTDTCMCGGSVECDSLGNTSKCVDAYSEEKPGILVASEELLPYLRLIDRHSCKQGKYCEK